MSDGLTDTKELREKMGDLLYGHNERRFRFVSGPGMLLSLRLERETKRVVDNLDLTDEKKAELATGLSTMVGLVDKVYAKYHEGDKPISLTLDEKAWVKKQILLSFDPIRLSDLNEGSNELFMRKNIRENNEGSPITNKLNEALGTGKPISPEDQDIRLSELFDLVGAIRRGPLKEMPRPDYDQEVFKFQHFLSNEGQLCSETTQAYDLIEKILGKNRKNINVQV